MFLYSLQYLTITQDFFDILFHRSQNSNLQAFKTVLSVFSLRQNERAYANAERSLFSPFAPEPPVTAPADPGPFYPL